MAGLGKLIDAVSTAGLGLDGAELAEALWLAKVIADGVADPSAEAAASPERARRRHGSDPALAPVPIPQGPAAAVTAYQPPDTPDSAPGSQALATVSFPGIPALTGTASLLRELRPLARRTPAPQFEVFDEPATVELSAAMRVPWPVTGPGAMRDRELCLVLDRDAAMAAWEGLAGEVLRLFEAVGGFRRIDVRFSESDGEGRLRLADRPDAPATEPLARLRDPTGNRIVVMLTTALGDAWGLGTAAAELNALAETGPVAVAQPLPSALWRRTGLELAYGRIVSCNPGRPGPLRVVEPDTADLAPIPVFELSRGWLAPWARTVAGDGSSARYPLLRLGPDLPMFPDLFPGRSPGHGTEPERPGDPGYAVDAPDSGLRQPRTTLRRRQRAELAASGPEELVRRFRSASSPDAYRLAVLLSVVGLNPPVMRLIQRVVMPRSHPSALAEVISGGLLEPGDALRHPFEGSEDRHTFVFRGGVGEVLRRALRRSESTEVLALTTGFMEERYDVPGRVFQGTLSRPSAGTGGLPFAYLSAGTLQRVAPNFPSDPVSLDPADLDSFAGTAPTIMRSGDPAVIAESVERGRRLLAALAADDPKRADVLDRMIELLHQRWRVCDTEETADLDEAIALAKVSLLETTEAEPRARRLAKLAELLRSRSRPEGTADHLIEAARVLRDALATAPATLADQERAGWLQELGDVSRALGSRLEEPIYSTEACEFYGEAARLTEDPAAFGGLMVKCVHARLDRAELTGSLSESEYAAVSGDVNSFISSLAPDRRSEAADVLAPVLERVSALHVAARERDRLAAYLQRTVRRAADGGPASRRGPDPEERNQ